MYIKTSGVNLIRQLTSGLQMSASQALQRQMSYAVATILKLRVGFYQTTPGCDSIKDWELAKNSRGVVGEIYERAASKYYSHTNSQATNICLYRHGGAFRHPIAFGVQQ